MPRFDFKCKSCGNVIELTIPWNGKPGTCPTCEGCMKKVYSSPPGVKFIGEGFTSNVKNYDWEGTDYDTNMRENEKLNKKLGMDE